MSYPILYVDDDEANLTVFQALFEGEFRVLTASGGAQALAVMAREEVAVLIGDQRMPGMTGVELAAAVRASYPDVVRYLVTAYADLGAAVDAINRGQIQRYVNKPWDIDELRRLLQEGLDRFVMHRRLVELERRMREVDRIYTLGVVSAGIAHELRNPICVADGNVDLAQLKLRNLERAIGPKELLTDAQEYLLDADQALSRIREIVAGVELTSRSRDHEASCDFAEVVHLTLRMTAGDTKHIVAVETELPPRAQVRGSSTRLGQVVLNLVLNAVQALPTRPYRENKLQVRMRLEDGRAILEVEDNGNGIGAEVQGRVFDAFFTTKQEGGTGLGLAISKQIVEELGGSIRFRTEAGRGTCFSVELPLADAEAVA